MYVPQVDVKILLSQEVLSLKEAYRKKFGEPFMPFNNADFPGTKTQFAGEQYKETLKKALSDDKPYHIESVWT